MRLSLLALLLAVSGFVALTNAAQSTSTAATSAKPLPARATSPRPRQYWRRRVVHHRRPAPRPRPAPRNRVVDEVNKRGLWKAEDYAHLKKLPRQRLLKLLGVRKDHDRRFSQFKKTHKFALNPVSDATLTNTSLPDQFDSRTQWPACGDLIGNIRDQSSCGDCWAVSTSSALSDRFCIASNGQTKVLLSASDIMSCCSNCGYGCSGGYPYLAYQYAQTYGVVSGGNYSDSATCKPYPFPNCTENPQLNGCQFYEQTPKCRSQCQASFTKRSYAQDKFFVSRSYAFSNNPTAVQREILTNGPVVIGSMIVYEDFMYYKSGIYSHVSGQNMGRHAIRIIGWGTEGGVPYWLVANSWGHYWGEGGLFRIKRGTNECNIEATINAALPDLQRSPKS